MCRRMGRYTEGKEFATEFRLGFDRSDHADLVNKLAWLLQKLKTSKPDVSGSFDWAVLLLCFDSSSQLAAAAADILGQSLARARSYLEKSTAEQRIDFTYAQQKQKRREVSAARKGGVGGMQEPPPPQQQLVDVIPTLARMLLIAPEKAQHLCDPESVQKITQQLKSKVALIDWLLDAPV